MKMADLGSLESFFWTFLSIVGLVLMALTYTYMDKLEKINCECAEHPYKKFIKNYIIFAILFLLVTTFLPPSRVVGMFGPLYALVYVVVKWVYVIATFIFFVYALMYVRYLAKEKCKCSEDIRRDVLYWWSVLEVIIFGVLVILPFLVMFVSGGVALAVASGKSALQNLEQTSMVASVNPLKAAKKVPGSFRKSLKKSLGK